MENKVVDKLEMQTQVSGGCRIGFNLIVNTLNLNTEFE